jgi:membrane associated rhomboid family serine protease
MIPLRDVIPSRTRPVVTMTLIALNVAAFLYEQSMPPRLLEQFVFTWGLVPAQFAVLNVFTSMFLHGGWMHLLGNMLFLWIFGDNVEDRMGHGRFLVFYLLCGTVAAMLQVAFSPGSRIPMVGASGAIAGVLGAYLVLFPRSRILTLVPIFIFIQIIEVPAIIFLGLWFALQLFSGVGTLGQSADVGGVAFWAHAGGFAAGMIAVWFFRQPERQQVEWWDGARRRG